jgi:protein TonB
VKYALQLLLLIGCGLSHAVDRIEELCPNALELLSGASFPSSSPPHLESGTVNVDFSVGVDGSIADVAVHSTTDTSLNEAALGVVSRLTCSSRETETRVWLPVGFKRTPPAPKPADLCPNFSEVMNRLQYPREAATKKIDRGGVVVEFRMSADGEISEVRELRSTHPAFTAVAFLGVYQLKCKGVGRDIRVQMPFGFLLQ